MNHSSYKSIKSFWGRIRNHLALLSIASLVCITPQITAQVITEDFKALPIPVENSAIDYYGGSVSVDGDYAVVGAISNTDRGPGYASVLHNTGSSWEEIAKLTASDGEGGDKFGFSVCISGDVVVVGAIHDDGQSGSAYVFEKPADGWIDTTETAKLTASERVYNDFFGFSVSVSGDVIVIGSPYDKDNGGYEGSVFVFEKPAGGWVTMKETSKLKASDGTNENDFGYSVSISGDVIVVGDNRDVENDIRTGTGYVFEKPPDGWADTTETAKLSSSNAIHTREFGESVSISGDVIVIGAPGDNGNGSGVGAGYVFEKPAGGWVNMTETAKLTASDGAEYDYFGQTVSISGYAIVIGVDNDDDSGAESGSGYVFEKPAGSWVTMTETAKLTASDGASDDQFGRSVSISGDAIVVGTPYDDDKGTSSGSVYIYEKPVSGWINANEKYKVLPVASPNNIASIYGYSTSIDGDYAVVGAYGDNGKIGCAYVLHNTGPSWETLAKLTASDITSFEWFGTSVSISGDVIVIGSHWDEEEGKYAGAAYVFEKPVGGWVDMTETAKLLASDGAYKDFFGESVSISGEVIVAGAKGDADYVSGPGAAYVFERPAGGWINMTETAKLIASDAASFDSFGRTLSISGDVIVIGAAGDDDNGSLSGSGYVFEKPEGGWVNMTETAKLKASDGAINDLFGSSVDISGDVIIIGAEDDDHDIGSFSGSGYVFERPAGGWVTMTETAKLTSSDAVYNENFGGSVSISDDVIVIGAPYASSFIGPGYSSAYVFEKPEGGWTTMTQTGKLIASDGDIGDYFGTSVGISGDLIVVGAPYDDDNGNLSGSAYFFQLSSLHDDEPPTISCIGNTTRNLLQGDSAYVVTGTEFDPIETDDNFWIASLTNDFNLTATLDNASFSIGTTAVTWAVTDNVGNEAQCSFDVVISSYDDETPTISCIGNTTKYLSQGETAYVVSGKEFDPIETDDNVGIASLTNDFNLTETLEGSSFLVGTNTVTWTVVDSTGNEAQCSFDVTVTAPTGIDLNLNPSVRIYPNPTDELLTIQMTGPGMYTVELTHSNGRIIHAFNFQGQSHQLDLSSSEKGVYFITIRSKDFVTTRKVIRL